MTLGEIAENYPEAVNVLLEYGLHCIGCHVASWETLEEGAAVHGITGKEFSELLKRLEKLETGVKNKTLDLRDMPPFERHSKIFEMWDSLDEEESMEITNDHEPKPLYYQFEAEQKGHFEWAYKKQGPKDWIFVIKKLNKTDKKQEIKNLIKQLKTEKNISRLKEKARNILKNISPTDLGLIEQEIIREGTTREEIRKLCNVHLKVMGENLEKTNLNLKPGHPIHTLVEEHKIILEFVEKLQDVSGRIERAKSFDSISEELKTLLSIGKHLLEADKHHTREEKALFPVLKKFGVVEPPMIMEQEHEELKAQENELYKTIKGYKNFSYREFIKRIKAVAKYLAKELPNHIFKENNILYPMAIQAIPESEWAGIKKECDKIGYCCFTPKA